VSHGASKSPGSIYSMATGQVLEYDLSVLLYQLASFMT
jgi:hypothetical protein